ncbi:MFS transporter [Veronia pacifica]|uniref:MFS transporter n=1 Tax=Veronia pacifica TaxID=1080227 RepID=A0A1C3ERC7_9GAMM|nr:MFS transporter [Veronia pacifica]ODA35780.1 MFS transporter [Veronia pacifica]
MNANPLSLDVGNSTIVPVASLSIFALASGYLMSLVPLALETHRLPVELAAWLASIYYFGLLIGALFSAKVVARLGHRIALMSFLAVIAATVLIMAFFISQTVWLGARFVAGIAVAGVFVVIESWLLMADSESARSKRLGLYMASLYGGTAFGQLGIGFFGVEGLMPFALIGTMMLLASLPPALKKGSQPADVEHSAIRMNDIRSLPMAAFVGCVVSGLLMGVVYGLLPLEFERRFSSGEQVGTLMSVVILGGMIIQPAVSWLNSRVSKRLLMALFSLLGVLSVAMTEVATHQIGTIVSLFLLGAATFALYPVAITLACQTISKGQIVAATELMLLSYSVGSVAGPSLAKLWLVQSSDLMGYFGAGFAATCIYMFLASIRKAKIVVEEPQPVAPDSDTL